MNHIHLYVASASALMALSGCAAGRAIDPAYAQRLRARTAVEFDAGIFYKPGEHAMGEPAATIVPLMITQTFSDTPGLRELICTPTASGDPRCDPDISTVYSATSTVLIDGASFDQVVYVWYFVGATGEPDPFGVRVVLGVDGYPMLWEALDARHDQRILFVARSLEDASSHEFGPPLSGRRYSIENTIAQAPNVVVVRILSDGPVPMGPWVYVSRNPQREITTLLCRCMPSQVSKLVKTIEYDLQPIEAIPSQLNDAWLNDLATPCDLSSLLRWPDFGTPQDNGASE